MFLLYATLTRLPLRAVLRRRLVPAVALGVLGGLVLTRRVLADAPSAGPSGFLFAWDVLWRGVLYGTADGALLSSFPWLVAWRALDGESSSIARRVAINLLALGSALLVTSAYHAGYPDFRGPKLAQANLGNAIASLPTLLSLNPVASPIAHAILHIAAVTHNPRSDLFLPPHEPGAVGSPGRVFQRSTGTERRAGERHSSGDEQDEERPGGERHSTAVSVGARAARATARRASPGSPITLRR